MLDTMIYKFSGGPVGAGYAGSGHRGRCRHHRRVYEPYLLKNGFINRTPRGRVVTGLAYQHLGLEIPQ